MRADTNDMMHTAIESKRSLDVESGLFGVLVGATSLRQGATSILGAIGLSEYSAAIAMLDRDQTTLQVVAESGAPRQWPVHLQDADASDTFVDEASGVLVAPLRAEGRLIGALLIGETPSTAHAISPRREAVASISAALHQLIERNDDEVRRRARARRSVESIAEAMAHQITNPLTGASAIAQMAIDGAGDEATREALRQVTHELSRAFVVLRDMLDFQLDSRAQDGVFDLNAFVSRLLRFRGYAIREQGITVETALLDVFAPVYADARAVELAFLETLRAAELRSCSSVNRSIAVCVVQRTEDAFAVDMTDSGPGDVPDPRPRYFDLEWRHADVAPHLVHDEPDLGLVDSVLRGCGGRLEVRGSKTAGTTFSLVLPRAVVTTGPS